LHNTKLDDNDDDNDDDDDDDDVEIKPDEENG